MQIDDTSLCRSITIFAACQGDIHQLLQVVKSRKRASSQREEKRDGRYRFGGGYCLKSQGFGNLEGSCIIAHPLLSFGDQPLVSSYSKACGCDGSVR